MTITHVELRSSREGKDSTKRASRTDRKYVLMGSDDIAAMRTYLDVEGLVPTTYDGLIYEDLDRSYMAPQSWLWTANYVEKRKSDESNDQLDVGEYRVSFDTTGGQVKLMWTPDHTNNVTAYPQAPLPVGLSTPTDFKGGINMRRGTNGIEPEGVEVLIPVLKFTIHYRRAAEDEASWFAFMKSIYAVTARTNNATFKTFDAGEVLFLGGNGVQGIESDPVLDFHFAASPNLTGLIFDAITDVDKGGHDYVWIDSEPEKDATSLRGRSKPIGVYVHQLYEPVSFAGLGVGS